MEKYLYGLKEIINHLMIKERREWKILLCSQSTNYNLALAILYLNYQDVGTLEMIFQEMSHPPFQIKLNPALTKNYQFYPEEKKLEVKELFLHPFAKMLQKEEEKIWGPFQEDGKKISYFGLGDK
ncbi:MAG: hypothetical protein Q8777_02455 [Candidatus Phytoplasma stylosanthis]|uniref:hypothetical protein n=1 Tax=Candidatus Phytoplasma stylosanthis TaxID=2798314 RepID=UPI00293B18EF|nr:hypothetical protein [Candidatus Phytoplasma stylosanthis]MDV3168189.1 hypothetical protein [Candidatus Phytoplasma stylosanthis]MDV3173883.1 hypothetical protein [Candidatus Phytoplasma stylosanthis]